MKKNKIKRRLLYSLLFPYLIIGVIGAIFLGEMYSISIKRLESDLIEQNSSVILKLKEDMNRTLKEADHVAAMINDEIAITKLRYITRNSKNQYYDKSLALRKLNSIVSTNDFIDNVLLFFEQSNIYMTYGSLRNITILRSEYSLSSDITEQQLKEILTRNYQGSSLVRLENQLFYVKSLSYDNYTHYWNVIFHIKQKEFFDWIEQENDQVSIILKNDEEALVYSSNGEELSEYSGKSADMICIEETDEKYGIYYTCWIDRQSIREEFDYFLKMFLLMGVSFGSVLILGIVIVNYNYNAIRKIILRLNNSGIEAEEEYGEIKYLYTAINKVERIINDNVRIHAEDAIKRALYGILEDTETGYQYLVERNPRLEESRFLVALFYPKAPYRQEARDKNLDAFIILNILEELLGEEYKCWILSNDMGHATVVSWENDLENGKEEGIQQLISARQYLDQHMRLSYQISISGTVPNLLELSKAYKQALDTRRLLHQKDKKDISIFSEKSTPDTELSGLHSEIKLFEAYLNNGRAREAKALVEECLNSRNCGSEESSILLMQIVQEIQSFANRTNCILELNIANIFEQSCDDERVKEELKRSIDVLCEGENHEVSNLTLRIDEIKTFISKNYRDPQLNVSALAEHFHMNLSYLSRIFKEQTEMNLLNYICTMRLGAVKDMLLSSPSSISYIAQECGFTNVNIMARAFKKAEGMTPGEYRIRKNIMPEG